MNNFTFSCFVNVSDSSLSDFGWLVRDPVDPDFDTAGNGYATAAIVVLLFLLAVPWNTFVIASIIKKNLYTQPIIMLLLNLTITNLLLALLVMPFVIVSGIRGEYIFGKTDQERCFVCQIGVLNIILPWVSVHTLALMSLDRFLYLKKPLTYTSIVTPKRTIAVIVAVWALCIVLAVPTLFGFGEIRFSFAVATCVPLMVGSTPIAPNYYYIAIMTIEALIPIVTLFVLYVWIVYIVRSSLTRRLKRSMGLASKSQNNERSKKASTTEYRRSQVRLVWLFGSIFTGNIVTWLPMVGLAVSAAVLGAGKIPTPAYSIAYLSFLSETVIHPILEACLIRDILQMITGCFTVLVRRFTSLCVFWEDSKQPVAQSSELTDSGPSDVTPIRNEAV